MNTRFFNAKILVPAEGHRFEVTEGELWVQGDTICYIGTGEPDVRPDSGRAAGSPDERPAGATGAAEESSGSPAGCQEGALGQSAAAKPLSWDREIDAGGNLLIPGFKNAHTHTAMTFLRSCADDLPLADWLNTQVFPREAQLTAEDIYWLDLLGIMEYVTSGITANFDMYFYPQMSARSVMQSAR